MIYFLAGFICSIICLFFVSVFQITGKESRREETRKEKMTNSSHINPPINYCGEIPIANDLKWNLFDGD